MINIVTKLAWLTVHMVIRVTLTRLPWIDNLYRSLLAKSDRQGKNTTEKPMTVI